MRVCKKSCPFLGERTALSIRFYLRVRRYISSKPAPQTSSSTPHVHGAALSPVFGGTNGVTVGIAVGVTVAVEVGVGAGASVGLDVGVAVGTGVTTVKLLL